MRCLLLRLDRNLKMVNLFYFNDNFYLDSTVPIQLTYAVNAGIEWEANYTLNKITPNSGTLSCFIHITNSSSILFKNCDISLVEKVMKEKKFKKKGK